MIVLNIAPWDSIWSMEKGGAPDEFYFYRGMDERGWKHYFTSIEKAARYMRYKPDLIVAHSAYSAHRAKVLARTHKVPFVCRFYGTFLKDLLTQKDHPEYIGWLQRAKAFVVVNDGTGGDVVAKHFGLDINFWINGIDKKTYAEPYDQAALKKELFGQDDRPMILSASRLVDWKRPDRLVALASKHPELHFVHLGDGPLKPWLLQYRAEVDFRGSVPYTEMPRFIKACDGFLSVSDLSNLSNGTIEAAGAGKRIFTFDNGTPELLKNYPLAEYPNIDSLSRLLTNWEKQPVAKVELQDWRDRINKELDMYQTIVDDFNKSP